MARRPAPRPRRGAPTPYERRIAAAIAKASAEGRTITRQEARGHRPREHATRATRAVERGDLTSAQRQTIRRFADKQSKRIRDSDRDEINDQLRRFAQTQGFERFEELKAEVSRLKAQRTRRVRVRIRRGVATIVGDLSGRSRNVERMEALANAWGLPDIRLLFYH